MKVLKHEEIKIINIRPDTANPEEVKKVKEIRSDLYRIYKKYQ